jgi:hypothetical protein
MKRKKPLPLIFGITPERLRLLLKTCVPKRNG